ncbi:hypothetical protein KK083_04210 [Fulvivirgaceae bacterium PWU4]|uniref:Uncharacterized protein n=1 Tax=Chryseosolibacter histidini TaxID=2782349 RepID=A0AAP2GN27_9BACT|nr:hypothetical protein [Chryseosolibacter histidini]MBT1696067.1 hypothetical protein [Chryseosolibacter histidini]
MEEKVIYTEELKKQLYLIKRTTTELVKEVPEKSLEQFLAEIKFVEGQLEELRQAANH